MVFKLLFYQIFNAMKEEFQLLKNLLKGTWKGEGFAKFPTIDDTAYTETWIFEPDETKDTIHYNQHTLYKNDTNKNGTTVFWDAGFILLSEDKILLASAQSGGRLETYDLSNVEGNTYTFDSRTLNNDIKTIRSQRVLHINSDTLKYELNMATKQAPEFQNHLKAELHKVG